MEILVETVFGRMSFSHDRGRCILLLFEQSRRLQLYV